jgi:hypothetical protein
VGEVAAEAALGLAAAAEAAGEVALDFVANVRVRSRLRMPAEEGTGREINERATSVPDENSPLRAATSKSVRFLLAVTGKLRNWRAPHLIHRCMFLEQASFFFFSLLSPRHESSVFVGAGVSPEDTVSLREQQEEASFLLVGRRIVVLLVHHVAYECPSLSFGVQAHELS